MIIITNTYQKFFFHVHLKKDETEQTKSSVLIDVLIHYLYEEINPATFLFINPRSATMVTLWMPKHFSNRLTISLSVVTSLVLPGHISPHRGIPLLSTTNQSDPDIFCPLCYDLKGLRKTKSTILHPIFRPYLTAPQSQSGRFAVPFRKPVSLRSALKIASYYCGFVQSAQSNLS